ncbi:MAG: valine--tRNA ligase [Spirochaetota bacterium]
MKKEISDRYQPAEVEEKWIRYWEENNSFQPNGNGKEPFCIVIPPPNVTGILHIGHALNHTIQDVIVRIERKKGKDTLWLPGMDHAGIATQMVVERELAKEGKKRQDFSREEFEKKTWEWKESSGGQITKQQRLLGESVDWSRQRFTLDAGLSHAVYKVFQSLYQEGLIYRGERIINWCPKTQTAISDIEVEYKEKQGFLYHIRYPIIGSSEYIIVATTRPETMLGDVAVCAHPDDPRYQKLKDAKLQLPLTDREIPLLYDSFVEKDFGTGLVKITPAHDPNDYEAGKRLGLQPMNIMNPDATLNEKAGKYQGMERFAARKRIVEDLQKLDLIEKIEDYKNSVGHNQRSGAIVEPYLSTQWFVNVKPLAKKAIEVVRNEKIQFIPKMWEKTYFEWMENIRDWCISRQLWWGHRIPAYYLKDDTMVIAESHEDALKQFQAMGKKCELTDIRQDEDVLDTWFSSGLWPFSTLGWPEQSEDLQKYYPNAILVTGFDIIFFWVARMIMMGLKFQDAVPFHKVLIHGLVRDKDGKKFSKSKGNTVDPLEMMKKYGTDSFRFFLLATMPEGKDVIFDEQRLDGYRSFCNKIWNSSRFILMNLPEDFTLQPLALEKVESTDLWILQRLNFCIEKYEKAYSQYHFYEMATAIYEFIWGDFCDWYIELVKPRIYGKHSPESQQQALQVLVYTLTSALSLLHPFMPFLTEEINEAFATDSLITSPWVTTIDLTEREKDIKTVNTLQEIVTQIRIIRADLNIAPHKKCQVILKSQSAEVKTLIAEQEVAILQLAKAESLQILPEYRVAQTDSTSSFSMGEIVLPLAGLIDFAKERQRLQKEQEALQKDLDKVEKKLSNEGFLAKAKAEIIEKEKQKRDAIREKLQVVEQGFAKLGDA